MARKILHLDLDAFFCAVEELRNPSLHGKPFAVGGQPHERGVVASCSYAARRCGVRSAMPMARALRLCPELIVVSSRHGLYGDVSESVMERVRNLTSLVEQVSIDEAFLDVSDLTEAAEIIARRLQTTIRNELSLPCSLGVASNKLVAKIANDVGKIAAVKNVGHSGPPNAITVVPPGKEAEFLAPLPVEALWGVGPKTAARLAEINILTISDLANWPEDDLIRRFGKNGHDLALHAAGIDDSPLVISHETKSISQETTFVVDIRDEKQLKNTLLELSERVGKRLRQEGLCGGTVKLKIRWPDFTTLTRQVSFETPIDQDKQIYQAGLSLFDKVWEHGQAVRLIGIGVSGLGPPIRQLSLWDGALDPVGAAGTEKERRLQTAIDQLREQFGDTILQRGKKSSGTEKR
jgi:DNA polymerase IV